MEYQLIQSIFSLDSDLTPIEKVLTNRGIPLEDIAHYLHTDDNDILDPMLLDNMREGAQMLIKHIYDKDKVFLQVDPDADGMTSSALLINYLNCLFPSFAQNNIEYRLQNGKEHGLILETIPEDVKLVIAPDSSSNDYEVHTALKNRGVDVLILDHHHAERVSENACVINNQLCDYPTKSLSGVGIVYKFCQYIDSLLKINHADLFLDLVALGMIADMMDLRDFETKHLINKGLESIRNPFISAMVEKQAYSIGDTLTPFGVAFYIAPQVNGTIRMGDHDDKLLLFESMLDFKAYELIPSTKRGCSGQSETRVEQACRNCTNIKNHQKKAVDEFTEAVEKIIQEERLLDNKILAIRLRGFAADRNLTGLIANQLMARYQRPVLLLNKVVNKDNGEITWEGSGRGYEKSKLTDFRKFIADSGFALYSEGHGNAFGAGFRDEDFDAFVNYTNEALKDYEFAPCYRVDFIFNGSDFNGKDVTDIAAYKGLWGQNVEEPLIAIEGIVVSNGNITLMSPDKKPTIKIQLSNGVELIKFKSSQEEYEKLYSENGCIRLNVIGKCGANTWGGRTTPQIIIEDYEVIGQMDYYF